MAQPNHSNIMREPPPATPAPGTTRMTDRPHLGTLGRISRSPLGQRLLWVLFAIVFYSSGLAFTTWLLEPEAFEGGLRWILVAAFPILVPAFFRVNRRLGCGSDLCTGAGCEATERTATERDRRRHLVYHQRPPG